MFDLGCGWLGRSCCSRVIELICGWLGRSSCSRVFESGCGWLGRSSCSRVFELDCGFGSEAVEAATGTMDLADTDEVGKCTLDLKWSGVGRKCVEGGNRDDIS